MQRREFCFTLVRPRGLHSFTFRLKLSTFCGIRLVYGFPSVY